MRVSRVSGVAVLALVASLLGPVNGANADPPPSAAITSPPEGTTVTGPITIDGEGHLDPASPDTVTGLQLYVAGAAVAGQQVGCTTPPSDALNCFGSFTYDPTVLGPGTYALQVDLLTTGPPVSSPSVHVTVPVPPPTLTMNQVISPVTGPVDISVEGDTNAASTDLPAWVTFTWGTTNIGTQPCPDLTSHSCPIVFNWDSTDLSGTNNLVATMTTASQDQVPSLPQAIEARNPPPTVTIDSPTAGAAEQGIVHVTAHGGVVGHQTDFAKKIDLFVNSGTVPVDTASCDTNARDCSTNLLSWDSTGRADGNYTLKVVFTSTRGRTGSDSVQVRVTSPKPTAVITSPVDGDTVFGNDVKVQATGTVDGSQTDTGESMDLYVAGHLEKSLPCPAASRSCPVVFDWDASGINGTRDLTVKFNTANDKHATSSATTVKVTTTPPSASISAPVNGATVSGVVSVVTSGVINPQQSDTPTSMQLLFDGTAVSGPQPCTGTTSTPKACSRPFTWDTSGMSGQHTLQAKFLTHKGFTALSPIVTITVVSPLPKVVITSPTARSTLHRTATVTVSGAIDATQTDSPSSVRLSLDGAALGGVIPCAPTAAAPRVCAASYTWSTVGLTGRHTLVASVVSAKGAVGTSTATSVYVYGSTKLAIAPAKAHVAGRSVTYTGRVTTPVNKLGVSGVKVKVVIRPAIGKAKTLYVLTNARGFFKVGFRPSMNSSVAATLVPLPYYGPSHSSTKLRVFPRVSCTVGSTIRRSSLDHGTCTFSRLPKSTKVTLQYRFGNHWYTLGSGRAPGAKIPFSFRFAVRGSYLVRLVLSATSVFAATTGPALRVQVT